MDDQSYRAGLKWIAFRGTQTESMAETMALPEVRMLARLMRLRGDTVARRVLAIREDAMASGAWRERHAEVA